MASAHHNTERGILVKFNENRSKGLGDMERHKSVTDRLTDEGHSVSRQVIRPRRKKTCLLRFANNTGADQPAHPPRLISAFVIHLSRIIISRLDTSEISIF